MEKVNRLKPTLINALPDILGMGQNLVCLKAEELQRLKGTALKATASTIDGIACWGLCLALVGNGQSKLSQHAYDYIIDVNKSIVN